MKYNTDVPIKKSEISGYMSHPAFGVVGISRGTAQPPASFFGSDIKSSNYVELAIRRAEYRREYGTDWTTGEAPICIVRLSPLQFANMLTSPNVGYGVPWTITFTEKDGTIKFPEVQSKLETIVDEGEQRIDEGFEALKHLESQIEELAKEGKLSKKAANELLDTLGTSISRLSADKGFYKNQARKEVEQMVVAAEAEVSAFVEQKIYSAGISALKEGFVPPQLTNGENDDEA